MPTMTVRQAADVPQPSRMSPAVRAQQVLYEDFIKEIGDEIGDLELTPDEGMRPVKVRLRRASNRLGLPIEVWDANGHVYFQHRAKRGRGRPRTRPELPPIAAPAQVPTPINRRRRAS